MSWSEAQKGKEIVKKIIADIDGSVHSDIPEPIGDDFVKGLYPLTLRKGRTTLRLKIPMRDLEEITRNRKVHQRIRQRLERVLVGKKVA